MDVSDDTEWKYILNILPTDFREKAFQTKALQRCRKINDTESLLRLLLIYASTDLSISSVATWGAAAKISSLSPPALFYRIRDSEEWLAYIMASLLTKEKQLLESKRKVKIVDATHISGPGESTIHWRLHVIYEPFINTISEIKLTTNQEAEKLDIHELQKNDIIIGDRIYAKARGIKTVIDQGADVIARVVTKGIRVCDLDRNVIFLSDLEAQVPDIGHNAFNILLPIPPEKKKTKSKKVWQLKDSEGWINCRVIGIRGKDKKVIWVITTLPSDEFDDLNVLKLYRHRWQIELLFKRLKSIINIDTLKTRDGPTARSWIFARLIFAILTERFANASAFFPWGYELQGFE